MSFTAGDHRVDIPQGGINRSLLLHVPPQSGPFPLVMMIHGAGGSADFAADETGWSQLADREGFAVVYPEGQATRRDKTPKFLTNPQEWNDGSGRGDHDDVGFLSTLLDRLAELLDPRRVYVTGFSNGAGMAFRLAAERADRFAAIAPVSGHYWVPDQTPSRPVLTYYLVGDSDPLVPPQGGAARTPWGRVPDRPSVDETLGRWGAAIGYPPRSELFPVQIIPRHGHHWPGGKGLLGVRLGGPMATGVNATLEIWQFFQRHRLTATP
ncbi:MAG TPA: PHB depolymerase family esterase [Gemmataceae bacterium]|nr:PHB depolymerase family esterase [Gemmataceae bacterium]